MLHQNCNFEKRTGHTDFVDKTSEVINPTTRSERGKLEESSVPLTHCPSVPTPHCRGNQPVNARADPEAAAAHPPPPQPSSAQQPASPKSLIFGNPYVDGAVNGIVEHENDADVDQMPTVPASSKNEPPRPSTIEEEKKTDSLELREQACKKEEEERRMEREKGKCEGRRKVGLPPEDLATANKPSAPPDDEKKEKLTGKRVNKKEKEKRVTASSSKIVSQEGNASSGIADDGSVTKKERKVCVHLEKGVNLGIVCSKIESAESTGCEYCREGANGRKVGKGKGKHGKKKCASDSRARGKATWICLQCGHFSCGGVGLPTSPQSHALRHMRQNRHPLVIQVENPHLRWCFSCSTLLPVNKVEDTGEEKDVFLDIVKLLKKQSSKAPTVDVEDIWFGSGSVLSEVKAESKAVTVVNGRDSYAVKGLVNLGNTCFFNSVMQNLLAMDVLREYLLNFEGSMGPLTSALKKIYVETCSEPGLKNAINPKSLFGCVCAKAPQFRGYQQQDSHELLRYLLDGLSSEDFYAKKTAVPVTAAATPSATFVDAFFGGQTSSTVCCAECGHSSVVYEPFLDLSLPLPTKKPPSKKAPPVSRAKKTKPPPKRGGRARPKLNKNGDLGPARSGCNASTTAESLSGMKDDTRSAANGCTSSFTDSSSSMRGDSLSCAVSADLAESSNGAHSNMLMTRDSNSIEPDYASVQVPQSAAPDDGMSWLAYLDTTSQDDGAQDVNSFAWLDYLEPESLDDTNLACEDEDFSVIQDPGSFDSNGESDSLQDTAKSSVDASLSEASGIKCKNQVAVSVPNAAKSGGKASTCPADVNPKLESTVDDWDDERPVQVKDNEILLLTYKEDGPMESEGMKVGDDISSSSVLDGEDIMGFGGLGDLFNEPEAVESETGVSNILVSESLGNGFLAENNTESDPDEVDTDSPVSVERCLAQFMKPERLSGEHAWHCENCSKLLKEERKRVRKNQKKAPMIQRNMRSDVCSSSEDLHAKSHICIDSPAMVSGTHNNGSSDIDEKLKKLEARGIYSSCPNLLQEEEERRARETALPAATGSGVCFGPSNETNPDGKSVDPHVFDNHVSIEWPSRLSEEHEVGEEEEEVDLKCVKVMRDATKRLLISKTPPILTIHLKRFGQDARGRLSKLNGHVVFKEFLDLRPYMDRRSTDSDKCIYRLVGVVEHSGSMRGGHYVAYVRKGERRRGRFEEENVQRHSVWYHVSDASVREATLEEVLGCEAYLLFYEEVKL
ncbi:Ubiquitin carboxyl-terminal hydrolase 2 [Bienertia sinuspersici]